MRQVHSIRTFRNRPNDHLSSSLYFPQQHPCAYYTPIGLTEEFKNFINGIIGAIPYLTASMTYKTETMLLQLSELQQELKVAAST